jgi:hypothetical protein
MSRAGDLIAVARESAGFTYYYWVDDRRAPNFARTVDIHRKPGYDPVELFLDPATPPDPGEDRLALAAKAGRFPDADGRSYLGYLFSARFSWPPPGAAGGMAALDQLAPRPDARTSSNSIEVFDLLRRHVSQ